MKSMIHKIRMFLNNNLNKNRIIFKKNVLTRILLLANNIRYVLKKLFYYSYFHNS